MASKTLDLTVKVIDKASPELKNIAKNNKEAMKPPVEEKSGANFLSDLQKRAKAAAKERRASGENALKKSLNSPGGLTQLGADALNIGGPVMVVEQLGKAFEQVTAKAEEIGKGLRDGSDDWKSAVNKVAQSLPMLGGFVSGFNSIREMFTHEKADIEQTAEGVKILDLGMAMAAKRSKEFKAELKAVANEKFDIDIKLSTAGLKGWAKSRKEFDNEQLIAWRNLETKREEQDKKSQEEHNERLRQLSEKRKEVGKNKSLLADVDFQVNAENDAYKKGRKQIIDARNSEDTDMRLLQSAQNRDKIEEDYQVYKKLTIENEKEVNAAKADTQAESLRMTGDTLSAELSLLQAQTEEKKKELDKQLKDNLQNANDTYADELKAQNKALSDALQSGADTKRKALEHEAIKDVTKSILQMEASAGNEAARVQLEKINRLKEEKELRQKLLAILNDTKAAEGDKADAKKQITALNAAHNEVLAAALKGQVRDSLESQSKYGTPTQSRAAQRELEKQLILDDVKKRQAELSDFLNSDASNAQKNSARAAFGSFIASQAKRYDTDVNQNVSMKPLATLDESRHLTGVAQMAQQTADRESQRDARSKEANDLLKELITAVKTAGLKIEVAQPA